jgi:protoporphyrinogen oxidase
MNKRIGIIGAGPAGLTAAYELSKNSNNEIFLFESSDTVGGMARSFNLFGQIVDLGPHRFFSSDTRVNKLWLEVVGKNYKMVDRTTRIFYKKKYFHYPLRPFNALFNLGIFETFLCIVSYFKARIMPIKNTDSFESWVTNRFGSRLYNIFFKSYTEKLWGISCEKLTSEFAQQRIKKFSLGEAILSAIRLNKNKHKTLVDQFAYPLEGNGYVYEKMKDLIIANGGNIILNSKIKSILSEKDKVKVIESETEFEFDHLISTMPIDTFYNTFKNSTNKILNALSHLTFRNTIVVYVKVPNENIFIDQWLYIQDKDIQSGRITNFNNWVPEIINNQNGTILALEYWCYENDIIWSCKDEFLYNIVKNDLLNCKFIKSKDEILDFHKIKINKCYPVYKDNYKDYLEVIKDFSNTFENIQLIGRYGSFKYNNQDHSILMGYLAAKNIENNENNNIWDINTDYEYHESSSITATGLSRN